MQDGVVLKEAVEWCLCFSLLVPHLGTHQAYAVMLPPELAVKRKGWKEEKRKDGNDQRRRPFGAKATRGERLVTSSSVFIRIK